jgi:hypothetical protein
MGNSESSPDNKLNKKETEKKLEGRETSHGLKISKILLGGKSSEKVTKWCVRQKCSELFRLSGWKQAH